MRAQEKKFFGSFFQKRTLPSFLPDGVSSVRLALFALLALAAAAPVNGDIPPKFETDTESFDFVRRAVEIPMRDGVKLHTVILLPRDAHDAPMLLERTPYSADKATGRNDSPHMLSVLPMGNDVIVQAGYIRVFQDVRGKYGSEGDYIMNRPLVGPLNPTRVDHATDTYDTIDWLVKNVPQSNKRVGIMGTSYDGFTSLMALVNPHPALKVSVPIAPMVDGWMGDDWFHQGAFREEMISYVYMQEATKKSSETWWSGKLDDYSDFLETGSAGEAGRRHGMEQLGFWNDLTAHPAYDTFWQSQAVDKILATRGVTVPTLLVDGLWDQEDIYGAPAVWRAVAPHDTGHLLHLAIGPWRHGGSNGDGSTLGPLHFDQDTGLWFRQNILLPFLNQYLKDGAPRADVPPVLAFETGTNTWRRYDAWPQSCAAGCPAAAQPLYLLADGGLGFSKPAQAGADEYVSDPAHPVPYRIRPNRPTYAKDSTWRQWLVDDQREFSSRPDVLTYSTPPLTAPVRIAGQPAAHLFASTTGTDADWVVKLIDEYPDEMPNQPEMGGYQLMVAADILRGRYRASFSAPAPIAAGKTLAYTVMLPQANHVFLPGHRIMVQIQSSWFPLYDRNPQSYVDNIFFAKPGDFRKAVQRVFHAPEAASYVEMPIVK
jgi:putative CocE/NonD family hydrolase